jgi:hypothetical protein
LLASCTAPPVEIAHRCGEVGLSKDGAGLWRHCRWNFDGELHA